MVIPIILLSATMASCCDKDEPIPDPPKTTAMAKFSFGATGGGGTLEMGKTFSDPMNRTIRVERFKFYVSNVYLMQDGNEILAKDVELVIYQDDDFPDPTLEKRNVYAVLPPGKYDGIKLGIGLDPTKNALNPGDFPSEHPLSTSQLTYWGAWSKYKFIMIEGFADLSGGSNLSHIFNYHTGYDTCYRELTYSFNQPFEIVSGNISELKFNIEINDIFFGKDTLDIATEPTWHGDQSTISRGIKISDNFAENLTIE